MGPRNVLSKMKSILSHVGAWAPMAEQKALTRFLPQTEIIKKYLSNFKTELEERLRKIYDGFMQLKSEGFDVDAVSPQAAIYLTLKVDLTGKKLSNGTELRSQEEVTDYLLTHAKLAVVPFYAFGASKNSPWYRLSVGTCKKEEIDDMLMQLRNALKQLL
jgi:aspartate aminotransferase